MESNRKFIEKLKAGQVCLGTVVSFTDPTICELLAGAGLDFVWIDMEHSAVSLETVQLQVMATQLGGATPLVRPVWNDPVLIKPILDLGAGGVVAPMVRTREEAQLAVAACRYPPVGIRGFGPRRPNNYGRIPAVEFCRKANQEVVVIIQVEHIDAVHNLDQILQTPGMDAIVVGTYDLAGSMGYSGEPNHPDVLQAVDEIIAKSIKAEVFVGVATGDIEHAIQWINKGVSWVALGSDFSFLAQKIDALVSQIKKNL